MDQFREVFYDRDHEEEAESEVETEKNPLETEAAVKSRLDRLESAIFRTLKYIKKTGQKPTLRRIKFKHLKPVLNLLMKIEVLQEILSNPVYKSVRHIARCMYRQLRNIEIQNKFVKRANNLILSDAPGFDSFFQIPRVEMFGKRGDILKAKLKEMGVCVSDKLSRLLHVRESYLDLRKLVHNLAKERCKVLTSKKYYLEGLNNRKRVRDYFLIGWKNDLEREWTEMSRQASKLYASKMVRKRLKDMKLRKKIMTVQLASLPAEVRRHLISTEVTKMYRDIKRNVEDIRVKKASFESVMLKKVEKRKQRKMLKVAKMKLMQKEEENRQRAMRARNKKLMDSRKRVKSLKISLRRSVDIIKEEGQKPIMKASSELPEFSEKWKKCALKSDTEDIPIKDDVHVESATEMISSEETSHESEVPVLESSEEKHSKSKIKDVPKDKRLEMSRKSYYTRLVSKIEKNELISKYTKRLYDRIAGMRKLSADQNFSPDYRESLLEQAELLEKVIDKRKEISERLRKETEIYEDLLEQLKISRNLRKMKKKREKEMMKSIEKENVFDFPEERQPLWSITGDGWSWTGYKVYKLDDPLHPWGFTQGLRERTPLDLGTVRFPASYTISGYADFLEYTDKLKSDYFDFRPSGTRRGSHTSIAPKSADCVSLAGQAFLKFGEGIEVPHLAHRVAKLLPLPEFREVEGDRDLGPEAFPLKEEIPEPVQTYGFRYVITLHETETIWLLDKDSCIICDEEEAEKMKYLEEIAKENKRKRETYEMNVSDALTQVVPKPQAHFASLIPAPERVSVGSYACPGEIIGSQFPEVVPEVDPNLAYLASLATSSEEDEDENVVLSKPFFETCGIIERILSTNLNMDKLIAYQGAFVPDPYAAVVKISCEFVYLWTFKYPRKVNERRVKRQSVTSIAWSATESVVAIGYGSFFLTSYHYGLICIWNLKNLNNPERTMTYKAGVCHVEFSSKYPYVLSCSFQDGFIAVYNIYPTIPAILCDNQKCTVHCGEPVWQVSWMNNNMGEDVLVAGGQTGEFYAYAKQSFSRPNILMAITRKEGKVVGFEESGFNNPKLNKTPAVMCFVPVPCDKENILVGTDDGSVRIISLFARNLQTDLFNAHRDKINRIEFSPFCSKLFFTVGGDFTLRIWIYGLKVPILSLFARDMYIEDASWSPTNPSLLVSVGGIYVDLWDLGRCGIGKPIATTTNPKKRKNSTVRFSNNGKNVGVGDMWGDFHIFCLDKMPFDPLLTQEALLKSLAKALAFTPEVLNQVAKMGPPFDRITSFARKV